MQAPEGFEDFVPAGLASLGIEADEAELAVMAAFHRAYWPALRALLSANLGPLPAEPAPDLSRPPSG